MLHVSAAEFVRHFAKFCDKSHEAPIYITHHGRQTHVLCAADAWSSINQPESRTPAQEAPDNLKLLGLAEWIDDGIIACDNQYKVIFANRVAHALVGVALGRLANRVLHEALPKLVGSLIETHANQTLMHNHPCLADIPSPFVDEAWLRVQTFPFEGMLIIRMHDITQEIAQNFKANVKESIISAMNEHGSISYVRVSVRGTIDRVDEPFARLLALPAERIEGIALTDLVAIKHKADFRERLESVLRGHGPQHFDTRLMTNEGKLLSMHVSVVRLDGVFGCEGAVLVLTQNSPGD